MSIPTDLKYSATHEWLRQDADGTVSIGITHHAQEQLGDIVYVEPPAVGRELKEGDECGVIESVKAAADLFTPIGGEVIATNLDLESAPEQINLDPYGAWLFRLRPHSMGDAGDLLSAEGYAALIAREASA
jgi:glycine cleavage system H protein